jgi:hypothetical protein
MVTSTTHDMSPSRLHVDGGNTVVCIVPPHVLCWLALPLVHMDCKGGMHRPAVASQCII